LPVDTLQRRSDVITATAPSGVDRLWKAGIGIKFHEDSGNPQVFNSRLCLDSSHRSVSK